MVTSAVRATRQPMLLVNTDKNDIDSNDTESREKGDPPRDAGIGKIAVVRLFCRKRLLIVDRIGSRWADDSVFTSEEIEV